NEPEITDVLFLPSLAVRFDRDLNEHVTLGSAYGIKPINQALLSFLYKVKISEGAQIAHVTVDPYFAYHHLLTVDMSAKNRKWSSYLSGTFEKPFRFEND